ncbi:MAG: GYD domain-containing protein [Boseongicola sp.]|nr:GYD domain-containing protein [Boseongicola sp.]MDD9977313.1 GYD domain-containing protein [Boseongicola sp.]
MPRFVLTGNYSSAAMKGMIEAPADREAASRSIVEAAGGKLESFYVTTGEHDFIMTISIDNPEDLLAGLMVAGASGAATNLRTSRAFTSAEFTKMQEKAKALAGAYQAPGS